MINDIHSNSKGKPKSWFVNILEKVNKYFGDIVAKETYAQNKTEQSFSWLRGIKILISRLIVWLTNKIGSFSSSYEGKDFNHYDSIGSEKAGSYRKEKLAEINAKSKEFYEKNVNASKAQWNEYSKNINKLDDEYAVKLKNTDPDEYNEIMDEWRKKKNDLYATHNKNLHKIGWQANKTDNGYESTISDDKLKEFGLHKYVDMNDKKHITKIK